MTWKHLFRKLVPVGFILILCFFINRYIWWAGEYYSEQTYLQPLISSQSLELILLLLLTIVVNLKFYPKVFPDLSLSIRLIYGLPLLLLSVFFLIQPYNFYFESYFLFDRILLLLLMLLSLYSPHFLGPYLIVLILLHHQYDFPLGMHPYPDKRLSLSLLIVSYAVFVVYYISNQLKIFFKIPFLNFDFKYVFHFSCFYVFIASYFFTAVHKISISPNGYEWLLNNDLINNITAMMNRGWLQSFDPWISEMIKAGVLYGGSYFQFFVLALELLVLFLFIGRKFAMLIISFLLCMHFFIFLGNGGFFIHWMLIGLLLLYLIKKERIADGIWTSKSLLAMIVLIPLALISIKPIKLGWFDSALDNRFELRLKKAGGQTHLIDPKYVRPYATHLISGTFLFASKESALSAGFINTDYKEVEYLRQHSNRDSLLQFIVANGTVSFEKNKAGTLKNFLKKLKVQLSKENPENSFLYYVPLYMNAISTHSAEWVDIRAEDTLQLVHIFTHMDKGRSILLKEVVVLQE